MKKLTLNYRIGEGSDSTYVTVTAPVVRYHNKMIRTDSGDYEEYVMIVVPSLPFIKYLDIVHLESWTFLNVDSTDVEANRRYTNQWPLLSCYETREGEATFKFHKSQNLQPTV